jgi:4-hydroxyphenylpyruvate dioxygenase
MDIDHVHFYVEDAQATRDWLIQTLGFQLIAHLPPDKSSSAHTEIVANGPVHLVLSSPSTQSGTVADYLKRHPPGIADLAFRVQNLDAVIAQAEQAGAEILVSPQCQTFEQGCLRWAKIAAWGDLSHTLIERQGNTPLLPGKTSLSRQPNPTARSHFLGIDHAVLNVAAGDLPAAIAWYEKILGFQRQQMFDIQTAHSGLCSQVLVHPHGSAQVPINEPRSATSQIQEFLDENRGVGFQHVALQTRDIVQAIAQFRQAGLRLLSVPSTYYTQLVQRAGFQPGAMDWSAIAHHEVLVDWPDEAPASLLLQTFTEPIFGQPTFFFELIQRQTYYHNGSYQQAKGFGEGNFQALFEAIEREQMKRGHLKSSH